MEDYKDNIIPHDHYIKANDRNKRFGHKSLVIWFVGLSGSGKSTLANALETFLFNKGHKTYILDGDNVRSGLNRDLDFSDLSRKENIRRIAEVGRLFVDAGIITLTAFISPFREDREKARQLVGSGHFFEVFVDCPLEVCKARDAKGLYKKAGAGKIKHFTGISSPFEKPVNPDLVVNTANASPEDCLQKLIKVIEPKIML